MILPNLPTPMQQSALDRTIAAVRPPRIRASPGSVESDASITFLVTATIKCDATRLYIDARRDRRHGWRAVGQQPRPDDDGFVLRGAAHCSLHLGSCDRPSLDADRQGYVVGDLGAEPYAADSTEFHGRCGDSEHVIAG